MSSLSVPKMDSFGHPVTGPMATTSKTIIGCPAPGCWRPKLGSCGLLVIGVGAARVLSSMRVIGVRWLVSTAGSIMASVILEKFMKADVGNTTAIAVTPTYQMYI